MQTLPDSAPMEANSLLANEVALFMCLLVSCVVEGSFVARFISHAASTQSTRASARYGHSLFALR